MDIQSFIQSLQDDQPPVVNEYATALWYDARGNWQQAHNLVQDLETSEAAWIHAYLHRKEGDRGNAGYWYNRAGKKMPAYSLQQEWEEIAKSLLDT